MGALTRIEWADHTFNPWIGCTRVSAGCEHCYAEALAARFKNTKWGPKAERHLTSAFNWRQPIRWNARAALEGTHPRVFCASMADVFDDHPSIRPEWRNRLWNLIGETPHLEWLLLTKRPHRWFAPFALPPGEIAPVFQRHVRLGCTIENDEAFEARGGALLNAHALGWKTFVSYEPALGSVDWRPLLETGAIGWLIAGGESGPRARPAHPDWFRTARDQCAMFGVPYFFKQWGEWVGSMQVPYRADVTISAGHEWDESECSLRIGKKKAGRALDGVVHNAFPVSA